MYVPRHYRPSANDVVELLRHHGAVDLVTSTAGGLRATTLPMLWIEPDGTDSTGEHGLLRGHFARANDHWRQQAIGEAMAIVRGPDAYITPSWYATKREHGRVVPTWNYITAHVHGSLAIHDDSRWVEENVRRLTDKHEQLRRPAWSVDDAPEIYVAGQLRAIVGVELRIARIEAKFKLSQNRSAADVAGAIAGLGREGRADMAAAMDSAEAVRRR
jgi:transcriptional regulator